MSKLQRNKAIIPFIVSLSFFMETLDSTILNTAIPSMAHSLRVDPVDLKIALISYFLGLAIFIPISGWVADKFGTKRVFLCALTLFTISSIWCGFSSQLRDLVIARFIQGSGGAFGLSVGRLIIIRTFGRQNFIHQMGKVMTVGALGMMLGPVVGGFITHYFSWQWVFWVNAPMGMLAIMFGFFYLEEVPKQIVPPLDKVGFILFGFGLAGLSFGLAILSESHVQVNKIKTILIASAFSLLLYHLWSKNQIYPIVKFELLRLRTFQIAASGNLLSRLGFGAIPFLFPLMLQMGLGFSPQLAGALLAPIALGVLMAKPFFLVTLRLFGYKRLLILNTLIAGMIIWIFTLIMYTTSIYLIGFLTLLYGLVVSVQYSAMNSLAYADIMPVDLSASVSFMSMLQQVSQSFGVAVSAILIRVFSSIFYGKPVLTLKIFHYTFFAVGLFTILSMFIFMRLKKEDGQQMLGEG